jgi:hypothetical protein
LTYASTRRWPVWARPSFDDQGAPPPLEVAAGEARLGFRPPGVARVCDPGEERDATGIDMDPSALDYSQLIIFIRIAAHLLLNPPEWGKHPHCSHSCHHNNSSSIMTEVSQNS